MRTEHVSFDDRRREIDVSLKKPASVAYRIGTRLLHEAREAAPPTIFFFVGFNFVVLSTNLLVADYGIALGNFMLATIAALVVGKAVLVANQMALLRRYDRAPLIQPILYKTAFYWIVVFFARLLERFVEFVRDGNPPGAFIDYVKTNFSWHRFFAISLWIFVLFLIYVTASEFRHLFGPGELRRLFFTSRPSELQLNRRQRIRELLQLSRLMDAYSVDAFRDTTSAAHRQLIEILQRLARETYIHPPLKKIS
jgi:hypothetical protein